MNRINKIYIIILGLIVACIWMVVKNNQGIKIEGASEVTKVTHFEMIGRIHVSIDEAGTLVIHPSRGLMIKDIKPYGGYSYKGLVVTFTEFNKTIVGAIDIDTYGGVYGGWKTIEIGGEKN